MLIYWHKRDLRLLDNPALHLSLQLSQQNIVEFLPILGLETDLIKNELTSYEFGNFYQFGFISAAIPLVRNYQHFGIHASLFYEPILTFLERLNHKRTITILVSHQEHGTCGTYQRDKNVAEFCQKNGIKWHQIPPSGVVRNLSSRDIRDKLVKQYLKSKALPVPSFERIKNYVYLDNQPILDLFISIQAQIAKDHNLQSASEKNAHFCLQSFTTERSAGYRGGISSPNKALESGSRLSQYLAFGSVSLRYVEQYFWTQIKLTQDKKIRAGILAAMKRLYWREHFIQRLETDSNMPDVAIHPDYNLIEYNNQFLESYQAARTGEPLIDACLRCLKATGFINFRMRAMLISYGVFGLDINWRDLGKFLATIFLDYEPGIHWSQIQMQSGVTGINTIRVYSPHKQLLDQDPDCIFVKKWIPELKDLNNNQIHDYLNQSLYSLTEGKYPDPIVDFKFASKINKAKIYSIRSKTTKESSQKVFIKHGSRKIKPKIKPKSKVKKTIVKKTTQTEELF
jgi:deoxyribodipyrimidine photo-lyase